MFVTCHFPVSPISMLLFNCILWMKGEYFKMLSDECFGLQYIVFYLWISRNVYDSTLGYINCFYFEFKLHCAILIVIIALFYSIYNIWELWITLILQQWCHVKLNHHCWGKVYFSLLSQMDTAFVQILIFQSLKVNLFKPLKC